jgi:hypothetical protein
MYNFADSSVTVSAFTSGANTALTLVATTAGLTTTAALVIYYDDQLASTPVTVSSLPAIAGTVTANGGNFAGEQYGGLPTSLVAVAGFDSINSELQPIPLYQVADDVNGLAVGIKGNISGTVTANLSNANLFNQGILDGGDNLKVGLYAVNGNDSATWLTDGGGNVPISGAITISSALPAGTNRIGVVTIGGGTVTIGAGTAQIGSVTASISNFPATQSVSLTTLPALVAGTAQIGSVTASISNFPATQAISISSVTVGNSVTIASLPALSAGTAQIGSVTASLAISSSAITSGSFTSLTSATLVPANTARKMATVYNLGAGQLYINAGASATTLGGGFMVALSSGDFYECDYTTTTLSAIFATAGTASWMSH